MFQILDGNLILRDVFHVLDGCTNCVCSNVFERFSLVDCQSVDSKSVSHIRSQVFAPELD